MSWFAAGTGMTGRTFSLRSELAEIATMTVRKSAHIVVLALAMLTVFLVAASAKPSLYEVPPVSALPDFNVGIIALTAKNNAQDATYDAAPSAAQNERMYFQAPPTRGEQAGRCSIRAIVFAKITLAQACF
jgi:hypothetical protein